MINHCKGHMISLETADLKTFSQKTLDNDDETCQVLKSLS